MNKLLNNKKHIAVFIVPTLLIFVFVVIVPLFITAYYSLFKYDGIGKMTFLGLGNYIKMFTNDKVFISSLKNSGILVIGSVFIQLPISFILASILAKGIKGEKFFRTVYFIPVVISSMVIGRLWISIFNSQYGLLNYIIRSLGYSEFEFAWMAEPKTAFLTTVIPALWQYIGYHMLLFYAGIKSISPDYYEAAEIDGATGFKATTKITIPLLAPVIKTCVVFALVGSIKAFDLIFVMTNGGPNNASHVPATLMYNNLFKRGQYGYGSAQAFFIVIACLGLSYVVMKLFKKAEDNVSA
ncbi:MAG: carbohydrate ABC transporter permease [Cellulosilyticaceae bacterium]